ncbi:HAD family hydrolase [Luteolibacter sp. AS25]|uniref:HAD family hydrolase n=1 Tax=Luteolibacter sp. AS25 TaxID=3135776 RepID=UPI00398AA884
MADFLFDIGNVLLAFDFEKSLSTLLPPDHPNPQATIGKLLERKDSFETGEISVEDFTTWALGILESDATPAEFHQAWQNIFTPNQAMWQNVRQLSDQGHRLILFSNINAIHAPWIFEEFPQFEIFRHAVLSFEAKSIKPQESIYQHAIDKYALHTSETFYIDDMEKNVQTGYQMGFQTHHYDINDHQAFEDWLSENLPSTENK